VGLLAVTVVEAAAGVALADTAGSGGLAGPALLASVAVAVGACTQPPDITAAVNTANNAGEAVNKVLRMRTKPSGQAGWARDRVILRQSSRIGAAGVHAARSPTVLAFNESA